MLLIIPAEANAPHLTNKGNENKMANATNYLQNSSANQLQSASSIAVPSTSTSTYQNPITISALQPASGGILGNVEGAYTSPPPQVAPDPYAAWGGKAAYNNLINGRQAQIDATNSTANDAISNYGNKYNTSILDFLDQAKLGQKNLDTQAAKNELAKIQGVNGILTMVGRGIQSGGVQLANRNAGDSSGAQAIANAYGLLGNQQMANIGNQYALGQQDVQNAQDAFNIQQQMGMRDLQSGKNDAINGIVTNARNSLAAIEAQYDSANLPKRIQLDQQAQDVRNRAVAALQGYDTQLTNGMAGIKAADATTTRANAAQMATAGYNLGNDAFNYTTQAPIQFQNTGPSTSTLPLYSNQYAKKTA